MRTLNFGKLLSLAAMPLALVAPAALTGCGGDEGACPEGQCKPDDTGDAAEKVADGKADAWNSRNNPSGLRVEMKTKLADLHGANLSERLSATPENSSWPDTYWPTYQDSTNHRWQKTGDALRDLSPMEKYDAVFNGWDPRTVAGLRPFDAYNCDPASWDDGYYDKLGPSAKYVSQNKGNQDTRDAAKRGDLETSCQAKGDSSCMRGCAEAENRSHCENNCHRGGVETWWGLCHAWAPAAILEKEPLHPVTMPTEFGDITFDISDIKALYAVIYDRSDASLIGGRCNDFDVKRDPKTGRITNEDCRDLNAGSFHVAMVNLIGLQRRGFVEDRTFDYQVWNQPVKGYDIHSMEEITVARAHELLKVDVANPTDCLQGVNLGAGGYCYNKNVDKLYKVEATLHWVTESHASNVPEGAENLSRYSRADRYTYILETKAGEVVGGEWYGSAINNHPDFIWLPFRARNGNPNVSMEKVQLLGRMSQQAPGGGAGPTEDVISVESGAVAIAIPDKVPAGISSTIAVGDAVATTAAKVTVDITHTYVGDLVVKLTSGSGQTWTLHNKEGGSQDDLKKTFTLNDVNGNINGTWTLNVADTYAADTGTLNSWKIDFLVGGGGEHPAAAVDTFSNNRAANIPDNRAAGVTSYIDVEMTGTVQKLELTVDIQHTYIADLEVSLNKDGVTKVLHNREGGSDDNIQKTYVVEEFRGQAMNGRWNLVIKDLARQDKGKRKSWSLKITH